MTLFKRVSTKILLLAILMYWSNIYPLILSLSSNVLVKHLKKQPFVASSQTFFSKAHLLWKLLLIILAICGVLEVLSSATWSVAVELRLPNKNHLIKIPKKGKFWIYTMSCIIQRKKGIFPPLNVDVNGEFI